jgi:hypothetical protein
MNSRNIDINLTEVKFKNNHVVYENFIKCTIKDYEFNLSYNPTLLSGSQALLIPITGSIDKDGNIVKFNDKVFYEIYGSNFGILKDFVTGSIISSDGTSSFSPYVTTIGLYNDEQDLLAVAKMAVPMPISDTTDMTFLVKFDTQWIEKPYFTPTPSPSRTPYPTPSNTPSISVTPSISTTPSVTPTVTPSITPSLSISPIPQSPSVTPTQTPTVTPSITPSPSLPCALFGEFTKNSGNGTYASTTSTQTIFSTTTSGTTTTIGQLVVTCPNTVVRLNAFSGTGGSTSQGSATIVNVLGTGHGNYAPSTTTVGPGGGQTNSVDVTIIEPGTYNVEVFGFFNTGTNPPSSVNNVSLFIAS